MQILNFGKNFEPFDKTEAIIVYVSIATTTRRESTWKKHASFQGSSKSAGVDVNAIIITCLTVHSLGIKRYPIEEMSAVSVPLKFEFSRLRGCAAECVR